MLSQQIKVLEFDKYIMQGGCQSLSNIEDLCQYGFVMCGLDHEIGTEAFDDVVIETIKKLRVQNRMGDSSL